MNAKLTQTSSSALIAALCLGACSAAYHGEPVGGYIATTHGSRIEDLAGQARLSIVDQNGKAIANARVLIGSRENVPFPGNYLTTDASGQTFAPTAWIDAQPVTIEAQGYVRATYFGRMPSDMTLQLNKATVAQKIELRGETKNFGTLPRDGFLDIGIVSPTFTRSEANILQVGSIISQENDRMSVFGQKIDVPSNITFPTQKESIILPITFEKPIYRMYVTEPRTWRVSAVHVRFPMKDVMDGMNAGRSFFDMMNYFEFREASVRDIAIRGNTTFDVPVNETQFGPVLPVTAPKFDAAFTMMAVSLAETGGQYYVSDAKRMNPLEKRTLNAPKGAPNGLLVSVLRRTTIPDTGAASEELTSVTNTANASRAIDFLPVVSTPSLKAGALVLDPPDQKVLATVEPTMTYAILSKVEVLANETVKLEKKDAQWELYAEDWAQSLTLPEMPGSNQRAPGDYRWTVLFAGQAAGSSHEPAGPRALEKVSHVTRSAVDFK